MRKHRIDRPLLIIALLLVLFGFVIFISASLGLLVRSGPNFGSVAIKQILIGLFLGGGALFILSNTDYKHFRTYSLYFFVASLFLTLLVFVPGLGFEHGGARRWLSFGPFTFQPAEFLKVAFVIYLAAWLSMVKDKVKSLKFGFIPFVVISGLVGVALLLQPDTDTFFIIISSGITMFIVAGGRWRDVLLLFLIGVLSVGLLVTTRPYLKDRFEVFINPEKADVRGSGYQINQSLIAIGSGGLMGRGFGQSVQKFGRLPEPMGDSIFAVAGEEFGFLGASFLIILFVAFAIRGLKVATRAPDSFSGLLALGIVILIISQSFINIASMLALFPLSGTPLVFVSQGGTALFMALAEVGILLSISRHQRVTVAT